MLKQEADMDGIVQEFLDRQSRSDERNSVFVVDGDEVVLGSLSQRAAEKDAGLVSGILSGNVITNEAVVLMVLSIHDVAPDQDSKLDRILDSIIRIPHPTVRSVVYFTESAISNPYVNYIAWLADRCFRHDEMDKMFRVAELADAEPLLGRVSLKVYDCMPISWALDRALDGSL